MSLKEFDIRDIEMGNLLFGNSRGEYQIPREWGNIFLSFLENNGFNSYGYPNRILNKNTRTEKGFYRLGKETKTKVETVLKKGTFVKENYLSEFKINGISYRGNIYRYRGDTYLIYPDYDKSYKEKLDDYQHLKWDWEMTLSDKDFSKYLSGKLKVPVEIEILKPSEDDIKIESKIIYYPLKEDTHMYFENDTFILRPYYWGDSPELMAKPNFVYKPENIIINWYKFPLRDAYINENISFEKFEEIVRECKRSVRGERNDN